jgi:hypothetical protein
VTIQPVDGFFFSQKGISYKATIFAHFYGEPIRIHHFGSTNQGQLNLPPRSFQPPIHCEIPLKCIGRFVPGKIPGVNNQLFQALLARIRKGIRNQCGSAIKRYVA